MKRKKLIVKNVMILCIGFLNVGIHKINIYIYFTLILSKKLYNKSRINKNEIVPGTYATNCEALGAFYLTYRLRSMNISIVLLIFLSHLN